MSGNSSAKKKKREENFRKLTEYLIDLPTTEFRHVRESYKAFESRSPSERSHYVRALPNQERYDVLRICHMTQSQDVSSDVYFNQIAQQRVERTVETQGGAAAALESLASMPRKH